MLATKLLTVVGGATRTTITINNSGNASDLENYQVKLELTSSNFDFSKVVSDGADMRVVDSDGTTVIPYHILSIDTGAETATIWAKVPSIPASSSKTIYITWGNPTGTFRIPPTGLFTWPTTSLAAGLVENLVYDSVTNKYYVLVDPGSGTAIELWKADTIAGTWTKHGDILTPGTSGQWDDTVVYAPCLIKDGSTWYLFYSGGPDSTQDGHGIGYATASSITGPYTRYASNPVVSYSNVEDWEQYRACEPYVYYSSILSKYVMLYMGDTGSGSASQIEEVGMATADAITGPWTKYAGNPIIELGAVPAWDAGTVADPFAVEIDGVAYIGYSGGATDAQPWTTGFVTTTDYVTFTKRGQVYGYGPAGNFDSLNAHRGAWTLIGDTWYFPYTGYNGTSWAWAIASMSALSTASGFDAMQVFDYYDDFPGVSLNANKWRQPVIVNDAGSAIVSGGVLTLTTDTAKLFTLVGRRDFGAGYMVEARTRHNNADGTGNHAAELGLSLDARSIFVRLYDYNTGFWIKENDLGATATTSNMAQAIDTGWHVHRVAFVSDILVRYQNDNNAWENLATNVPAISLKPWMFVYANTGTTTSMDVDYFIVRKHANPEPSVTISL